MTDPTSDAEPHGAGERPRFADWSDLHGGASATGLVHGWLRAVHLLAVPLARWRVAPNLITGVGLFIGAAAMLPAVAGGRWLFSAAALIGLSALLDGLDGAVAVLSGRVTATGAKLDRICDRATEVFFVGCLWLAGGSVIWSLTGLGLGLVHESVRSWARYRGVTSVGTVTVSERPTRVLVVAMFLVAGGTFPAAAGSWAGRGAVVLTVVGAIGLVQVVVALRRAPV